MVIGLNRCVIYSDNDSYLASNLENFLSSFSGDDFDHRLVFCSSGIYLYQANCLDIMDILIERYPDGCFDMIFADPPYFLSNGGVTCFAGRMVEVDKGDWDRSDGIDSVHRFNHAWLSRCRSLLKPDGTIWVSGTMHVIFSVGFAMQQLGFKLLNDVSWEKTNPPPNLACRYFTHSTETVIWARKSEQAKHVFNYSLMKKYNDGKQMKSVWRMGAPRKQEKVHGKHPTQKPYALLERCIEASTHEGDFIFDPFAGSCTTGVAAARLGRKFCGVELEDNFIKLSQKRLQEEINAKG